MAVNKRYLYDMDMLITDSVIPKYSLLQSTCNRAEFFHAFQQDGLAPFQKDYFLTPHRKDYYLFVLVKQGNSRHWVDMVPYDLQPDTFYFTVPHQVHVKENINCLLGNVVCFTDDFLAMGNNYELKQLPIIENRRNAHKLLLNDSDLRFIEDLSEKIVAEYESTADWKNGMLHAYLRVLLIYLSRIYTIQFENNVPSADGTLLKRFQNIIEEQYLQLHDVASYADLLNITPGHLSEVIKKQSGKTAIEHVHERILLEAKRLLFHTELSIKEIAYQLNFSDVSYFVRFFKRLSLQTPALYREEFRKKYHVNP